MCGKHNYKIVNKDFFKSYKVYQKQMCPFFFVSVTAVGACPCFMLQLLNLLTNFNQILTDG